MRRAIPAIVMTMASAALALGILIWPDFFKQHMWIFWCLLGTSGFLWLVYFITSKLGLRMLGVHGGAESASQGASISSAVNVSPIISPTIIVSPASGETQRGQQQRELPLPSSTEPEKLGDIPFDYLPDESPLQHGWVLPEPDESGSTTRFSSLPADSPVRTGLSVTGWNPKDYPIVEARKTKCNLLRFAANFEIDGRMYTLIQMPSSTVGQGSQERWIQMGVNIGASHIDDRYDEGVVSISGKSLRGGWESFDILLDDVVRDTFGKRGFIYGAYGKLLRIRLRGSLSISPIEFYRSSR